MLTKFIDLYREKNEHFEKFEMMRQIKIPPAETGGTIG
ncbi:hypothetical protein KIS4809_3186 [Bacillus sp. ZZV12-4809]|nr:hypothetical protein KIS4809_3186 [Bacillus sp. ZZV12-4809]